MSSFLLSAPAFIKILGSLAVILVANKLFKTLSVSLILGSIIIALWAGQTPSASMFIAWKRASSSDTLFLILVVMLVIWLSSQMGESGVMNGLVKSIMSRLSKRTSMAVLPAIIGLLPMPGGAIFSAPLVDDCDKDKNVDPILKVRINYWFRHIWEYWWPLYPGVILAVAISGVEVWQFILLQIPITFFSIAGGYLFLLRKIKNNSKKVNGNHENFFYLILPIIVIIAVYTLITIFFPSIEKTSRYLPMAIGIILAMFVLQIQRPVPLYKWKAFIFSKKTASMVFIVFLVRIYGAFIEAPLPDGNFLMDTMRMELGSFGIPLIALIMILPFISGISTGIAIGFVGASFPILINLIGPSPDFNVLLSTVVLAYSCGHIGQLLSPVHVCLIVTNEHFKTNLLESLSGIIKPCFFILAGALIVSQFVLNIM